MNRGFSVIGLLLLITVIILIVFVYIIFNDPVQKTYKTNDLKLQSTADDIFKAAARYARFASKALTPQPLEGVPLNSDEGLAVLKILINNNELRASIASSPELSRIYLTSSSLDQFNLCFAPRSFLFKIYRETRYDSIGNIASNCYRNPCYYCYVSSTNFIYPTRPTPPPSDFLVSQDPCDNYDPERPLFPFTKSDSSKWVNYGCTFFITQDKGCSSQNACGPNRRQLHKKFSATGLNFLNCFLHQSETIETYCVDEPAANCINHPETGLADDYNWGCDSPRRPFSWK